MFNEIKTPPKIYPHIFRSNNVVANRTNQHQLFIYIVGCGGTGGYLIPQIARLLSVKSSDYLSVHLVLIDKDNIEEKNLARQNFIKKDLDKNKAEVLAERYSKAFGINISAINDYIPSGIKDKANNYKTLNNYFTQIEASLENMTLSPTRYRVIIGCVDNVDTRKIIGDYIDYSNINYHDNPNVWIDAGNSLSAGQVIFEYQLTKDLEKTLDKWAYSHFFKVFPDLENEIAKDHPDSLSCADHALSSPQNIAANITAANLIFNYFNILYSNSYALIENAVSESPRMLGEVAEEMWYITNNIVYFNIATNTFNNECSIFSYRNNKIVSSEHYTNKMSVLEDAIIKYKKHFKADSEIQISVKNSENEPTNDNKGVESTENSDTDSSPSFDSIFQLEE